MSKSDPAVKRYDLNLTTCAFLGFLAVFFGLFLFYPVGLLLKGAFVSEGRFTLRYFELLVSSPLQRESLRNSFAIALLTTALTTVLTLPLAQVMTRLSFRGKALAGGLLLVPMIMPPFVGAIGLRQLLSRFGSLNLLLTRLGIIEANQPVDWLGGGGRGGGRPSEVVGGRGLGSSVFGRVIRKRLGLERGCVDVLGDAFVVHALARAPVVQMKTNVLGLGGWIELHRDIHQPEADAPGPHRLTHRLPPRSRPRSVWPDSLRNRSAHPRLVSE